MVNSEGSMANNRNGHLCANPVRLAIAAKKLEIGEIAELLIKPGEGLRLGLHCVSHWILL
jgi:hypothetical protein